VAAKLGVLALQKESRGQDFIWRGHTALSAKPGVSVAFHGKCSGFVLGKKKIM